MKANALAVVAGEVHVMQRVMRRTVDDLLKRMVDDHVRVVDLYVVSGRTIKARKGRRTAMVHKLTMPNKPRKRNLLSGNIK